MKSSGKSCVPPHYVDAARDHFGPKTTLYAAFKVGIPWRWLRQRPKLVGVFCIFNMCNFLVKNFLCICQLPGSCTILNYNTDIYVLSSASYSSSCMALRPAFEPQPPSYRSFDKTEYSRYEGISFTLHVQPSTWTASLSLSETSLKTSLAQQDLPAYRLMPVLDPLPFGHILLLINLLFQSTVNPVISTVLIRSH